MGQELAKVGVQGAIVLSAKTIELHPAGGGAPVSIDVELIVNQWPLLPEEMRTRKANEMARRLVGAQRAAREAEGHRDGDGDGASRGRVVGAVAGLFVLLVLIGAARFAIPRLIGDDKPAVKATGESAAEKKARLGLVCDVVRDHMYKGESYKGLSLEGWAVDLWLASKKGGSLRASPALTGLVGVKLPELPNVIDGTVAIADGFDGAAAARSPGWSAATVILGEGYGRAFFDEESRPHLVAAAERVAEAAGADHAALYARCAHLTATHDIGAWFHGPDVAGATAVMVYQMGLFADPKVIDTNALAALQGGELDALRKAAGDIAGAVPGIVGSVRGASVSTTPGATLGFSLWVPVRSQQEAIRKLAKKMGVGLLAGD